MRRPTVSTNTHEPADTAMFDPVFAREAFGPGYHAPVIFDRHLRIASHPTRRRSRS